MGIRFKELHVVSDLHIGGDKGFQIFDQGDQLAALIGYLKDLSVDDLGLVLNGDIVDFLAEQPAAYLDAEGAVDKLERTFTDPAFKPVWTALGNFVHKNGRRLVLVLGNHDVELALPAVRERLLQELCGADAAARGRVIFAMDGDGFSCTVGGKNVLCLHGNEVDTWNVIDYTAILDTRRAINRRQPIPQWEPNAGTRLVIDIMNSIKRDYPFVDLLKPEARAVPAVLMALDPGVARKLGKFGPVAGRYIKDAFRRSLGFLSAEDAEASLLPEDGDVLLKELLSEGGLHLEGLPDTSSVDDLLDRAEELAEKEGSAVQFSEDENVELLGMTGMIIDHLRGRSTHENLRDALGNWLGSDATFELDTQDECYKKLDEAVGRDVDFLIAGHTHLERSIPRSYGSGAYFNSGTWIRLIRLTPEILKSKEEFEKVFKRLKARSMEKLDKPKGLIMRRPTVVSIIDSGSSVYGELRHVELGKGGDVKLVMVADSRQEPRT